MNLISQRDTRNIILSGTKLTAWCDILNKSIVWHHVEILSILDTIQLVGNMLRAGVI